VSTNGGVILIVEDNGDDATLIRLGFQRAGFANRIQTAASVADGLDYLNGAGRYADRAKFPFPSLVILDHKVPGDGWPVIEWVRQRPGLILLPVIVFSGSEDPNHRRKALELGANAYHIKPADFSEFSLVIKRIGEFWLRDGHGPGQNDA
jgi:CheY-like chemotaxis protein